VADPEQSSTQFVAGGAGSCRVPARLGLVGNPSDGYGGAVVAVPVTALVAEVTASPNDRVVIGEAGGRRSWPSVADFLDDVRRHGHGGDAPLLGASLEVALSHLIDGGWWPRGRPGVSLSWSTTIPRSVGLAGSSALAVGVVRAVSGCCGVRLDARVEAALALRAEVERLGITAGWQDRIVQAVGAPVLVDCGEMVIVDGLLVPTVRQLVPRRATRVIVGWQDAQRRSSDDYHAAVRARSVDDADVMSAMVALAGLARDAADAIEAGDVDRLSDLMDAGWHTRQAVAPLPDDHTALVEAVRSTGVAATTPGSGGAVVALVPDDRAATRVRSVLAELGANSVDHVVR
jgi:glucuronokinase